MSRIFWTIFCYCLIEHVAPEPYSDCIQHYKWINTYSVECSNLTSLSTLNIEFSASGFGELVITNSKINKLSPTTAMDKYSKLDTLVMDEIGVEEIEPETFKNVEYLTELSLRKNRISVIPARAFGKKLVSLRLGENVISSIDPEAFSGMESLQDIHLDNNQIKDLGEGLFRDCPNLSRVFGSYNEIRVITPKTFQGADNLDTLDLDHNPISKIPDSFPKLRDLCLDNGDITVLPDSFFKSTPVITFTAAHNKIQSLEPTWFENADQLWKLDVSFNNISHFDNLPTVKTLGKLEIASNQLTALPVNLSSIAPDLNFLDVSVNKINQIEANTFENLPNLQELNISHNEISHISGNSLTGISRLHLSHNKLTADVFDSLVQCCQQLQFLDLSNNEIPQLDLSTFSKFVNLTEVYLQNNKIKSLSKTKIGVVNVRDLNLAHNRIENFQLSFFEDFENLFHLDLRNNEISQISPGALTTKSNHVLNHLNLNHNKITSLDQSWYGEEAKVNVLYVAYNKIKKIEKNAFTGNTSVGTLDVSHNEISTLSENSFAVSNLQRLLLNQNTLTTLSDGIFGECPNLHLLDLSYNNIETIQPDVFKHLSGLELLHLAYNRLTTIPDELFKSNILLNYLYVSHNELTHIPPHILGKSRGITVFSLDVSFNKLETFPPEIFPYFSPPKDGRTSITVNLRNNNIGKDKIEDFLDHLMRFNFPSIYLETTVDKKTCESIGSNSKLTAEVKDGYCFVTLKPKPPKKKFCLFTC